MKLNKSALGAAVLAGAASFANADAPIITGIIDGPFSGGEPKAIEVYACGTVDFSNYILERSANSNNFPDDSLALTPLGIVTDSFVYLLGTGDTPEFESIFGTGLTVLEGNAVSGNGNDAFRIVDGTGAFDQFGVEADPTSFYLDSWAYRNNGTVAPNPVDYVPADWTRGGNDALDGFTAGQVAAAVPFGTYVPPAICPTGSAGGPILPGAFDLEAPADTSTNTAPQPFFNWSSASGGTVTYTFVIGTGNAGGPGTGGVSGIVGGAIDLGFSNYDVFAEGLTLSPNTTYWWNVIASNTDGDTPSTNGPFSFETGASPTGECLIISEVSSGPADGSPQFVELTNVDNAPIDLQNYQLRKYDAPDAQGIVDADLVGFRFFERDIDADGSLDGGDQALDSPNSRLLLPGESFVVGFDANGDTNTFFDIYGVEPGFNETFSLQGAEDSIALLVVDRDGVDAPALIDSFGEIGNTPTLSTNWNYTNANWERNPSSVDGNAGDFVNNFGDWTGVNYPASATNPDFVANSSPGSHTFTGTCSAPVTPAPITGACCVGPNDCQEGFTFDTCSGIYIGDFVSCANVNVCDVTFGAEDSCLIISQIVDGDIGDVTDPNNGIVRYVEITNTSNASIDLTNYDLAIYNANGPTRISSPFTTDLTGTILAGETVYIAYNDPAPGTDLTDNVFDTGAEAPFQFSGDNPFNGNDAIALRLNAEVVDVYGVIGSFTDDNATGNDNFFYGDAVVTRNTTISEGTPNFDISEWTEEPFVFVAQNDTNNVIGTPGDHTFTGTCGTPEPTGACCTIDLVAGTTVCVDGVTASNCPDTDTSSLRQTFSQGLTCSEVSCDAPGACCFGTTCLFAFDAADCAARLTGGTFEGAGTFCTDASGVDQPVQDLAFPTLVCPVAGCPNLGDTNNDGVVDFADLTTLLANFNLPGGPAQGDTDGSGTVDFSDLTTLLANFNLPCP